ncbi:MAG TPA: transglycosylase SLT domain-containing protein, partial [Candidatus Binatia bacterium]|nr:transglycosylase SLT domain-containing protein [Candidatus Binatia bacterium]
MDGLTSAGGLGQRLGALRITPDALRGAASLLGPSTVDPLAYTLNVDSALRAFLGFTRPLPPRGAPPKRQSSLRKLPLPNDSQASAALRSWFAESAFAAASDTSRLNQWVPETRDLQDYLVEIRKLLAQTSDGILSKSQLAQNQHQIYRQIVFTAAWQESCWRQFIKKGQKLTPLTSKTGDIGLMQVNRNVWRGLYDVKGLGDDIEYNGNAGGEILYYYLTRHALTKNEDKQAGGHLARATYAAYNGGPGHLSRYRAAKQRSDL